MPAETRGGTLWGVTISSLKTKVIDNQPVLDKEITPQTIAIGRFYLWRNLWSSPGAEKCSGRIVCQLVIFECRTQFTNTLSQVFFRILNFLRLIHRWFHRNFHHKGILHEWNNILPWHHPPHSWQYCQRIAYDFCYWFLASGLFLKKSALHLKMFP